MNHSQYLAEAVQERSHANDAPGGLVTAKDNPNSMITTVEPGRRYHVTGHTQSEVHENLNTAVEMTRQSAQEHGWMGILVTRHGPGSYTVALSPGVPYGVTAEQEG